MATVSSVMTRDIVSVPHQATLGEVARALRGRNIGSAIVLDDAGGPVGIISERELVDSVAASRNPDVGIAESWMRGGLSPVPSAATIAEASTQMREQNVRHLPVVDDGQLVGIVSIRDLLAAAV